MERDSLKQSIDKAVSISILQSASKLLGAETNAVNAFNLKLQKHQTHRHKFA